MGSAFLIYLYCLEISLTLLPTVCHAAPFIEEEVLYNLNTNESATNPLDYWGVWPDHFYNPSPTNWRFPFYSFFLDRFVNGDPTNDNANGTTFEQDILSTQLRHGGDIAGVVDSLDYLQGMGIKGIYIAGSPFINLPWTADSYSPVDFTILDHHFGTIQDWRDAIDEIHSRGMYIILDNTFATMADLIGFEGYLNTTTPFTLKEHKAMWKTDRHYLDFTFSNEYNPSCQYPRFWNETGFPIDASIRNEMVGCYNSEFDQYGDTEAFGVFPDFQRELSKFASVQDRLREWVPSVRAKIQLFSCMTITMLDIDGFRFDKATQITVDAQGDFANYIRTCAENVGKTNFFMPGEITGGNDFGSIFLGRGRQPDMLPPNVSVALALTPNSSSDYFIRDVGHNSLDAAAFHYTIYRSLTRFLGMDGNLEAGYDANGGSWTDTWNTLLVTNDLLNPNTESFDPRHLYGVSNQDVFRWPAIANGTERQLLGLFITTLHFPGIPLLSWGEEQSYYVLDNTASNYIYGRQSMSSSPAWQLHGCYVVGSVQYYNFPLDSASRGCQDDSVSLDHRDPSHPVRNLIKHMYFLREQYPVLNDGWYLQQLSNQTSQVQYPGSGNKTTETGMWSVLRAQYPNFQDLSESGPQGNQSVWLVYSNVNTTMNFQFNCSDSDKALISPFESNSTVKNLFYPFDELNLTSSNSSVGFASSSKRNGCVGNLTLNMYEFKAYVPKNKWVSPPPMITRFLPGHDARLLSQAPAGGQESVNIEIHFSKPMNCSDVTSSIRINSTTEDLIVAQLDTTSVQCATVTNLPDQPHFVGGIPTAWTFKARLVDVSNGIHQITVQNASSTNGSFTNSNDTFMFRVGQPDNPMVFSTANYTLALVHQNQNGTLYISQKAAGADKFRYSLNWGSSWSNYLDYRGGNETLQTQTWTGTKQQAWQGTHLMVQYWSKMAGSASVIQHADLETGQPPRRFPHIFAHGSFNQFGYDRGLNDELQLQNSGNWEFHFMSEWPDSLQLNIWGMDASGQPDETFVFGDVDGDMVLDRLPPSSLSDLAINFTSPPPSPHLAWLFSLNDGQLRYTLIPVGNRWLQLIVFILFTVLPVATAFLSIQIYMKGFYSVKFNQIGIKDKGSLLPLALRRGRGMKKLKDEDDNLTDLGVLNSNGVLGRNSEKRRCVLIATMEYDIEDWSLKIKIGGLGVMAQLMGKNLEHQDLIWVVPCVGGLDYPVDTPAVPMNVTILGDPYEVSVQYHKLRNITYVLLDAPIFRKQTKSEPYPPRMDDLDSAVYYSAWNQCIAQTIQRFPIDLYHINDYHGAAAPLYLLPDTIPCCLSLHNAEFQGLWPMRTSAERKEVCEVFNLSEKVVQEYVQFGSVFNLLHAGASYLRVHQKGYGAVGVSNKYGPRSWARYPIFWGLSKIGKLPNPDPSDTDAWDKQRPKETDIQVDSEFETKRAELKRQAQEWAQLEQRADAELFVFVGRWSNQKGVDLIADVFPAILEQHQNVQLICVGPVIDLYGKFAALKLAVMMKKYPGRIFSRPEFTQLPPFIFSGAEFALIPSRDEPFGLVAVEFGRKGALGVGARVGGLGQMPGWWYTVESMTTSHLLKQFKGAIESALKSDQATRAVMRARSAKQRFPVQQWKEDLERLQTKSIKFHHKELDKSRSRPSSSHTNSRSRRNSVSSTYSTYSAMMIPPEDDAPPVPDLPTEWPLGGRSRSNSVTSQSPKLVPDLPAPSSSSQQVYKPSGLRRQLSLGSRKGPGHSGSNDRPRVQRPGLDDLDEDNSIDEDEYIMNEEEVEASRQEQQPSPPQIPSHAYLPSPSPSRSHSRAPSMTQSLAPSMAPSTANSFEESPIFDPQNQLTVPKPFYMQPESAHSSVLSIDSVTKEKKDFKLQKVDPSFTDSNGEFYNTFEKRLEGLTGKNSESEFCIEEFLEKSERSWFDRFRDARLGRTPINSRPGSPRSAMYPDSPRSPNHGFEQDKDEFLLGRDYKPPKGLKKYLSLKLGDWPVYTLFLAFGQIISANSYQVTLLTGAVGQSADRLYVVASIYLVTSILWWILYRRAMSVICLSSPFAFYGLAFLFLGIAPFASNLNTRFWIQNVATGLYATASSSGAIFFALNFGDEGGAPVKDWIIRACLIQGTQTIWNVVLWLWGSNLAAATASSGVNNSYQRFASSPKVAMVTIPAAVLLWAVGIIIYMGLPDYYRQRPGSISNFYIAMFRRKIVLWTLVTVLLQNFFLSAPYGRNWQFLWSSRAAPAWAVLLLVLLFFVVLWVAILYIFVRLSKSHSWILPIFAIGLGAPRWCQMFWSTSSIGLYLPWAGDPITSALVSRSLWLWLGLLDTIQGVGFGMIFLQTLTRIHVAFTLIAAQVLGSVATIVARAAAPDAIGPGSVFPDLSVGVLNVVSRAWFWVALAAQLIICIGYFKFFRREQLNKP